MRLFGRIISFALIKNINVEVDLTRSLLKHIFKKDLYIADLDDFDTELSKNLQFILDNDVSDLGMNFSYDRIFLGMH